MNTLETTDYDILRLNISNVSDCNNPASIQYTLYLQILRVDFYALASLQSSHYNDRVEHYAIVHVNQCVTIIIIRHTCHCIMSTVSSGH